MAPEVVWHTYRSAARRVDRSIRTIRYWRQWGMPMEWQTIEGQRTRVVREDVLLKHFRQHLKADPIHQQRMRTLAKAERRSTRPHAVPGVAA